MFSTVSVLWFQYCAAQKYNRDDRSGSNLKRAKVFTLPLSMCGGFPLPLLSLPTSSGGRSQVGQSINKGLGITEASF